MVLRGFRLSKNLYNEKGRPPYPYKSAKSRDLCVAFCTSQGRGAPLVRWPDGHTFFGPVAGRPYFLWSGVRTAILSLLFCVQPARRGSAVWERRLAASAGAQYGSGGTPPAPCKNSKKWPKPLFRHAQGERLRSLALFLDIVLQNRYNVRWCKSSPFLEEETEGVWIVAWIG